MESLFRYIWRNSRREQAIVLFIVVASLPFYFVSLDVPKYIINDAIQGRAFSGGNSTITAFRLTTPALPWLGLPATRIFDGVQVTQLQYLLALSGLFLALVLINGGFKYVINLRKGALGERLLQRLRLDLFNLLLRLSPEAARHMKPSEAATVIKDEVEPIGGFVGDAFVQPVYLGGQAATALTFILLQNIPLGLTAAAVVLVQAVIIPKLRREQLRLGRLRQEKSRALAGRIGEAVGGLPEINNHASFSYERSRVATRLEELFHIRYGLFRRKFSVKFLNNLLAQVTPFIFYSIGGYFVLRGTLDIGQLVAVIAAYRELPPPVKELIDWDQQRLDVEIKYQNVVEQFAPAGAATKNVSQVDAPETWEGAIECRSLTVAGSSGDLLLEGVSATIPIGMHVALLSTGGDGASVFAQTVARRITQYDGEIRIAGVNLAKLPKETLGARVAFAGPEPIMFDATIRDNILYGLAGRTPLSPGAAGDLIDDKIRRVASAVGLDDEIYRLGLGQRVGSDLSPDQMQKFLDARRAMRAAMRREQGPPLIDPFEPAAYNRHSTILENLLFGATPGGDAAHNPALFSLLRELDMSEPLSQIGRKIAATVVEIFADLDPENFLFQQFSFLPASQIDQYREILVRLDSQISPPGEADAEALMSLAFLYVEPHHRLGLLTSELESQIVSARSSIASRARELPFQFERYDLGAICNLANVRDNLLFGRVARETPGAEGRVLAILRSVCAESGIDSEILRLGLDYGIGHNGCLLHPHQRQMTNLARCLIKEPDVLILNDAIAHPSGDGAKTLASIRGLMAGRTLIVATRDPDVAQTFDLTLRFEGARLKKSDAEASAGRRAPASARELANAELAALGSLPIFSDLDAGHLKLLAFTSERFVFSPGAKLLQQGDPSDSAFVIVDGEVEIVWERPGGNVRVNVVGKNTVIGEIGIVSGAPRSASVAALTETAALRIRADVLLGLMAEFPQISLAIMRDQIRRIVLTQDRLTAGVHPIDASSANP